jgi:hypothetical protein
VEIQLVASEFLLLGCDGRVDVTDIGKPLGAQQRLTDILRRETDHRYLAEPDGVGLPCWLSRTRGPPRGRLVPPASAAMVRRRRRVSVVGIRSLRSRRA